MKKLLTLVLAGGMIAFYACGPSKEELAKREKHKNDSIHMADSMAQAAAAAKEKAKQDSIAQAEMAMKEKAKQDSIMKAEEEAKAKGAKGAKGGSTKPGKMETKQQEKKELKKRG